MRKGLRREEGSSATRRAGPLRVLFICSRNRKRSPTAEAVFAGRPDLQVASAGLAADAEEVVTPETLEWAQLIFVMETVHRARLQRRFGAQLRHAKVICLDIADRYAFMDDDLVKLLSAKVKPHLLRYPALAVRPFRR